MSSRYANTKFFTNTNMLYDLVFENRGVSEISQFGTTTYTPLSVAAYKNLSVSTHMWQTGDRLEKLASMYYGDPKMWWVIARYNSKPTDSHYKFGDTLLIPTPLTLIVNYYLG